MCSNSNNNRRTNDYFVNGIKCDRNDLAKIAWAKTQGPNADPAAYDAAIDTPAPRTYMLNGAGLDAAKALTANDAPAKIYGEEALNIRCRRFGMSPAAHALVRKNAFEHSAFVTTIDLRDDEVRAPNGDAIHRGAIYEVHPERVALHVRRISVQLWVEMPSNHKRALRELDSLLRLCQHARALDVEVIGEDNLACAEVIRARLIWKLKAWKHRVAIKVRASLYESGDAVPCDAPGRRRPMEGENKTRGVYFTDRK